MTATETETPTIARFDNPETIQWSEPPAQDKSPRASIARFDAFAEQLKANPGRSALYRKNGKSYFSLSDSQRERWPNIRVENRTMAADDAGKPILVDTWLVFDPAFVSKPKKAKATEAEPMPVADPTAPVDPGVPAGSSEAELDPSAV